MRLSHLAVSAICLICTLLVAVPVFSQDAANTAAAPVQEAPAAVSAPDASSQASEIAIYGEVQAVDSSAGSISVQYYDYDSDSEKMSDIVIAASTKMENAANISEIKKGDWVDVTYSVADGKNAAKVITVEKEEAPMLEEEAAPQASAPANVSAE